MKLHPQQGERKGVILSLISHCLYVPQFCQLFLITNTTVHHSTKLYFRRFSSQFYRQNTRYVLLPLIVKQGRAKIYLKLYFICMLSFYQSYFGKGQTQLTLKISVIFFFSQALRERKRLRYSTSERFCYCFALLKKLVIENICFHITVTKGDMHSCVKPPKNADWIR